MFNSITKSWAHRWQHRDQLLTNKSPVKENNGYNSTTFWMLLHQLPPHIYKAKNPPSSGNNLTCAAGGRASKLIYYAAVDSWRRRTAAKEDIGHRKRTHYIPSAQARGDFFIILSSRQGTSSFYTHWHSPKIFPIIEPWNLCIFVGVLLFWCR